MGNVTDYYLLFKFAYKYPFDIASTEGLGFDASGYSTEDSTIRTSVHKNSPSSKSMVIALYEAS